MFGCGEPEPEFSATPERLPGPEMPADAQARATVVHAVTPFALEGCEETMNCNSWTVDNDAPLYVQSIDFQNAGSFHHCNWFVVPEATSAALAGTVLFAQSTRAQQESVAFVDGATIRIPARSKIAAGVHMSTCHASLREIPNAATWFDCSPNVNPRFRE